MKTLNVNALADFIRSIHDFVNTCDSIRVTESERHDVLDIDITYCTDAFVIKNILEDLKPIDSVSSHMDNDIDDCSFYYYAFESGVTVQMFVYY